VGALLEPSDSLPHLQWRTPPLPTIIAVSLIIAIALALFVLPSPWNVIAVTAAAVWELATALGGLWWSQRHAAKVGVEALLGREVEVRRACHPLGEVRVRGEIWQARCEQGADAGETVRIVGLDGLTLLVEPVLPA
jgi:membrane protein implicated in regulation of membrane protease activity